ncbi:enoyl-CoA hydratase/isomerase family protein [Rhodococcus sp. 14C212]|uniref:enoyl-CoA hydratase-related protein n=1 Tax=Rhodococcus sp. 14C212 TaxID=2711209 RepID=UPI0013EC5ED1|nr:enoyl-CoA hydratase/isomerase family protein [Rhodococcus sp. 14C212]
MSQETRPAVRWERDSNGVVTLTLDDPTQPVNTLNDHFVHAFAEAIDHLESERDSISGVIVRSAKSSFLAGGDLKRLVRVADRDDFLTDLQIRKARLRRLERFGRPVVAMLEGSALGGGLELALACHHRVAVRNPKTRIGLPEATLGLLPGSGGLVRTTRMLGGATALPLILSGIRLDVDEACTLGLVDAVFDRPEQAETAARAWIRSHPQVSQPWDVDAPPAVAPPAGDVAQRLRNIQIFEPDAVLAPAVATIRRLVAESSEQPFDEMLNLESEGLADLVVGAAAKRTIATVFLDTVGMRRRLADKSAPPIAPPWTVFARDEATAERCRRAGIDRVTTLLSSKPSPDTAGAVLEVVCHSATWSGDSDGLLRLFPDRLGDGGHVVEMAAPIEIFDAFAPTLVRAGILPFLVSTEGQGMRALLEAAAVTAEEQLQADGFSTEDVVLARKAVGMAMSSVLRAQRASARHVAAGTQIVDAVASAAERAAAQGILCNPQDLDVASVRLGGLPAWTGGAGLWRALRTGTDNSAEHAR